MCKKFITSWVGNRGHIARDCDSGSEHHRERRDLRRTRAGDPPLSPDTDYLIDHMTLSCRLCNSFGPRLSGHLTKAGPRLIHGWLSGLCAGVNTGESVSLLLSSLSSLCDAIPFHIHLVRRFLNRISFSYFDSVRLDFLTVLAPRLNCIPREYYLDTL